MLASLKKIIYRLLCNNITGSIIYFFSRSRIPDIRWRGFRFNVPSSSVNKQIAASVFWGFYESAEIRFIEKYLRSDLNVIELGSSIGIVSAHIVSKLNKGRHFITVEANPFLIDTIKANIKRHQKEGAVIEVLNHAVAGEGTEVMLNITSNNTETRIINDKAATSGVPVKAIKFSELVKNYGQRNYSLVCDIEGSEVEILLNEKNALMQCSQLFIELHDSVYNNTHYSVQMLKDILVDMHGFQIMKEHGPVIYFAR
jgi:FkbM family methyltransferase